MTSSLFFMLCHTTANVAEIRKPATGGRPIHRLYYGKRRFVHYLWPFVYGNIRGNPRCYLVLYVRNLRYRSSSYTYLFSYSRLLVYKYWYTVSNPFCPGIPVFFKFGRVKCTPVIEYRGRIDIVWFFLRRYRIKLDSRSISTTSIAAVMGRAVCDSAWCFRIFIPWQHARQHAPWDEFRSRFS